jgi:hypothetical protein
MQPAVNYVACRSNHLGSLVFKIHNLMDALRGNIEFFS